MTVNNDYLQYPWRRHGYDHNRYEWSMLANRPAINWPDGKKLAVWVNVSVQQYPLNQRGIPFKVPNGMTMPYPDLRHFSLRDYGNRVGIYRFIRAFEQRSIRPTFALSAQLAETNPYLLDRLLDQDAELLCHGWNMDHLHYGGQDQAEEAEIVKRAVNTLRERSGRPIRGWLSPARNQSEHTPDLLAAEGIEYCCDWVNDDMPYRFHTAHGDLTNMPLPAEIEDQFVLVNNLHTEDSWVEQVQDAFDFLRQEAGEQGGRVLGLNIHPWMLGQPHRIGCLETVLDYINGHDDVWQATASEILEAFNNQTNGAE